jgi:hypothetical protein
MGQRVSLCWMLCWMQASVNMMMVAGIAGAFWGARAMPSSSASATGSIRAHSAGTAGLVRQWGGAHRPLRAQRTQRSTAVRRGAGRGRAATAKAAAAEEESEAAVSLEVGTGDKVARTSLPSLSGQPRVCAEGVC